jgi:predicted nucleotidyltransferase component of viral defense system
MKLDMFDETQKTRIALMRTIAKAISKNTKDNFVLKGGTALLLGYQLPRFSTDLDFDGKNPDMYIDRLIELGCKSAGIKMESLNIRKDTGTTKRYMMHYEGSEYEPLKIEISYRQAEEINENDVNIIDDIRMYKIDKLAELKLGAFTGRLKARDVFDISFILENHPGAVKKDGLKQISERIQSVGIDSFLELLDKDKVLRNIDKETVVLKLEDNAARLLKEIDRKTARNRSYSGFGC